jgi:hypothetical protein
MAINRKDIPLAATPTPRVVQDTIKPKKSWAEMTLAEKGAKKKELIASGGAKRFMQYKDSVRVATEKKIEDQFAKNAATRGMSVEQLRSANKKADVPACDTSDPNFKSGKCGISKAGAKQSKKDWSKK